MGRRLALLALLLLPAPATAQEAPDTAATPKDWPVALTLELLVPLAGHAYAGDIERGIFPTTATLAGVFLIAYSSNYQDWEAVEVVFYGAGLFLVGKVWGAVSAVRTANDHNREIRERVTPGLGVTPDGRALVGVSVRF